MCKHGTSTPMMIGGRVRDVDSCLVPLVAALNNGGIPTKSSCCGHGHIPSSVILNDDRFVVILTRQEAMKLYASYPTDIHGNPASPPQDAPRLAEVATDKQFSGTWNNWIAPFHRCASCGDSLNWQQSVDVFDRPLITASCACGMMYSARLSDDGLEVARAVDAGNKLAAELATPAVHQPAGSREDVERAMDALLLAYVDKTCDLDAYHRNYNSARARLLSLVGTTAETEGAKALDRMIEAAECMRDEYSKAVLKYGGDNAVLRELRWAVGHLETAREVSVPSVVPDAETGGKNA